MSKCAGHTLASVMFEQFECLSAVVLEAGQFFDIDLTVYWFNPVSLAVRRRAVSGHPSRRK